MNNIGSSDEKIKYILKNEYIKNNEVVVDDLFILGLEKCKNSQLKYCLICNELIKTDEAKSLAEFYKQNTKSYEISEKIFNRISSKDNCAGIFLITKIKEPILNKENSKFILVCDGLEISGNIGTIFRTAEAVNVDLIIFTNVKAKINDEKVVRSSRGMIFNVPSIVLENKEKVLTFLKKNNSKIIVCEPEQGKDFKTFNYNGNIALIIGNERFGVQKFWFENNPEFLKVPMYGEMDSLNVGVATSLILYEAKYDRK